MKSICLILTALSLAFSTATFAKSKKADAEQFSCADSKYCKEMTSCADRHLGQARFLTKLDQKGIRGEKVKAAWIETVMVCRVRMSVDEVA